MNSDHAERHISPRTLAGATILQIVPALREEPVARTAVDVANALLQSGARALIAAEDGPLAEDLRAFGGEWVPLANDTINPFKLRRCAQALERLIASERVDIVHAQSIGGAWVAHMAATQIAVWLVTTLADVPPASGPRAYWAGALARGDRVITPSNFAAAPIMQRFSLPRERLTIIPRSIDTEAFNPAAVTTARINALREAWRVSSNDRVVLVPGRVAPWNGQVILPHVTRMLIDSGVRDLLIVMAGEHHSYRKYARFIAEQAKGREVGALLRFGGHCHDMPAAYAAGRHRLGARDRAAGARSRRCRGASYGSSGRHLQYRRIAGARRDAAGNAGRCPHWVACEPGNAADFARALSTAFSLEAPAYRAMGARARQFAEYMFSPRSIAVATRAVYTSLLARDT